MGLRAKLLLVFLLCGVAPTLLLGVFNYVNGVRTIEALAERDVVERAERVARAFAESLHDREANLLELSRTDSVRDLLKNPTLVNEILASSSPKNIPDDVRNDIGSFFQDYRNYYAAITCLDASGNALFRVANTMQNGARLETNFVTGEEAGSDLPVIVREWKAALPKARDLQRSMVTREPFGASVNYIVPVFDGNILRGAFVVAVKLNALFSNAESTYVGSSESGGMTLRRAPTSMSASHFSVILDDNGQIMHHSESALRFQPIVSAMPYFEKVGNAMKATVRGERGAGTQSFTDADGAQWVAAYRPLKGLNLALAVAGNYDGAVADLRRAGVLGMALAFLVAVLAASFLLTAVERVTRRIKRVARAASRIEQGEFEQTILVRASDETKSLAESFNSMSARLRELIAREAETRQFEAVMRISAMLTHDLKNSINTLGLLVGNMERHFHRADFREDAIASLRSTTDKLRGLVTRLNDPANALSETAREAAKQQRFDLTTLIRETIAATTNDDESDFYQVEVNLPASPIYVRGDVERIEKVVENLIINAKEALKFEGGRITVAASQAQDESRVFFTVADTGRGMTEEFKNTKLFRPFATTKTSGIGLGLYTCREIVEAHGGHIEVESTLDVGTRFRVVLPSTTNGA